MHMKICSLDAYLVAVTSQVLSVGSQMVRTGNLRKIWTTTDFPKREEIRRKRRFAKTLSRRRVMAGFALSSFGDLRLVRPTGLPTCGLGGVLASLSTVCPTKREVKTGTGWRRPALAQSENVRLRLRRQTPPLYNGDYS